MKVWVDQDLCTGDGLCAELCPSVFVMEAGVSIVTAPTSDGGGGAVVGGAAGAVEIAERLVDAVLDAAEECPGECIFVEG